MTITNGFRCQTDGDTLNVYMYGEIFAGDISAKAVAQAIDGAKGATTINAYVNSPGGSVFEAFAIFNLLQRANANVVMHIDGVAASAASVVAMAGDKIRMAANAYMMIHDPTGLVLGNSADMRFVADKLDRLRGTIVDTYAARTGNAKPQLAAWMNEEKWFDATEAEENGFADSVTKAAEVTNAYDLSVFNNTPATLLPQAKQKQPRRDYSRQAVETIVAGFPDIFGDLLTSVAPSKGSASP